MTIARRRAQEESFRSREAYLKEESKTNYVVQWQEQNVKLLEQQQKKNHAQTQQKAKEEQIDARRAKLMKLYDDDMNQWKNIVVKSQYMSTEEQMEQIREKAYRLKAKREAERQEYVKKCCDRQWRDACDEARTLDSKARLDKLMHDRKHSVVNKEAKKESREDAKTREEWNRKMQDLKEKEIKDHKIRNQKNLEMKLALDHQVMSLQQKKTRLEQQKRDEDLQQIKQWELENQLEHEKHVKMIKEAHQRGDDIFQTNLSRLEARQRENALQRENDLLLLKFAQEKERIQIENELAKKDEGKEMAKEYKEFSHEQMMKDEIDNSRVNKIRNDAMEEIWTKRDNQIKAERDARNRLMDEVNQGRLIQISTKKKEMENEQIQSRLQVLADKQKWERQEQLEKAERDAMKAKTVENMEANKRLIRIKEAQQARQSQEKHLLNKQIQYTERQRKERLDRLSGNVESYFPLKHTNWYS